MSNTKITMKILEDLGFTKYEIRIIIELYSRGPLKADEIADYADVPLARTYDTLGMLKRKKFVTASQGRPRTYSALSPQIAVSSIMEQEKQKFKNILGNLSKLGNSLLEQVQSLYLKNYTQITPEKLLSQLSTLDEATEFTIKLIQSANNEILIFSHVFNWFVHVKDHLKAAINRGCTIRLLMQTNIEDQSTIVLLLEEMGIEVKTTPNKGMMTRGTLVDNKTVIFVIWASEEGANGLSNKIHHPHYSSNPGIIEVFNSYFNYLWEKN